MVGFAGVIVNALNLMPIGSLDGGRIAMSTFGRKAGGVLGTLTLLLQVWYGMARRGAVSTNFNILDDPLGFLHREPLPSTLSPSTPLPSSHVSGVMTRRG